ncbi:hypothetical protein CC2G_010502 [Coprinopsis cinerea AmutBmut pab1-1]|nr:hypothetical protein CC2G_010502 [Coprinopsis cinerea AmutBmut pab1-1]
MYPLKLAMNAPPSPPETNVTFNGPSPVIAPQRHPTVGSSSAGFVGDSASIAGPALVSDTPVPRIRRQPSIFYNSPGNRAESRERTPSLSSKLLVVVVPPVAVVQEHGNLGQTLSSGPLHRLSQGIIMPLFPNMYGQLTAIAKEFNFPSITGLCLYYCYTDGAITMTPRLSEEIWTTIWGLHEVSPQARERRPPIAGRLEFDIDTGKARWYGAWLSSRQREPMDYPFYNGSSTAPPQHHRGDSRFTFPHSVVTDDFPESIQQHSAPVPARHVPRKLSLVERFDVGSIQSTEIPHLPNDTLLVSGAPVSSHILSPIKQQEEPQSARAELDNKVNTWRATAIASPEAIPSSFEPPSVPAPSTPSTESLRLEDYQWSVSSVGPDDNASFSADIYVPSVHLCDRVNGSVASTASYCTSPGPSDYSLEFPLSDVSRLPSPDLAHRMYEEAPLTPLTTTSWGAPSHYAYSLSSEEYQASIDLGYRATFSRPSTPGTATTWGPASDDGWYPDSPVSSHSVHLGLRGDFSRPTTPFTATSWGASTGPSSPLSPYRLPSPDAGQRAFDDVEQGDRPWRHAWPYNRQTTQRSQQSSAARVPVIPPVIKQRFGKKQQSPSEGYPHFDLYPAVLQPQAASTSGQKVVLSPSDYPNIVIYSPVTSAVVTSVQVRVPAPVDRTGYPHNLARIYEPVSRPTLVSESSIVRYPYFDIYPAVYPFNLERVYPQRLESFPNKVQPQQSVSIGVSAPYPFFNLYPAVYPFNLERIYSHMNVPVERKDSRPPAPVVSLVVQYPHFDLYPAVYPFNMTQIYPRVVALEPRKVLTDINCIPESRSYYPYLEIYPAIYPYNLEYIYVPLPSTHSDEPPKKPAISVTEGTRNYPIIEIYRPVYPYNLDAIYPSVHPLVKSSDDINLNAPAPRFAAGYPHLEIYTPVYPFFSLYPPAAASVEVGGQLKRRPSVVSATSNYPYFDLYPAVYPHFDLYPSVACQSARRVEKPPCRVSVEPSYPYFNLYPAVYPHFVLWPSLPGSTAPVQPAPVQRHTPDVVQTPLVRASVSNSPAPAPIRVRTPPAPAPARSLPPLPAPAAIQKPSPPAPIPLQIPSTSRASTPQVARVSPVRRVPLSVPVDIEDEDHPEVVAVAAQSSAAVLVEMRRAPAVVQPSRIPTEVQNEQELAPAVFQRRIIPTIPLQEEPESQPLEPPKDSYSRRRSGRLTHAELHAMVMMEKSSRGEISLGGKSHSNRLP